MFLTKNTNQSIQMKSNNGSDDHISDLQDSMLVQDLMVPSMMVSKCSKYDTSSNGERKYLAQSVIEKKNGDCLRDVNGH